MPRKNLPDRPDLPYRACVGIMVLNRSGRVFIWLTDDHLRLPVQIQVRLQLTIGTITLQLEKEGK